MARYCRRCTAVNRQPPATRKTGTLHPTPYLRILKKSPQLFSSGCFIGHGRCSKVLLKPIQGDPKALPDVLMSLPDFGNEGSSWSEPIELLAKNAKIHFPFVNLESFVIESSGVDNVEMGRNRRQLLDAFRKRESSVIASKLGVRNVEAQAYTVITSKGCCIGRSDEEIAVELTTQIPGEWRQCLGKDLHTFGVDRF